MLRRALTLILLTASQFKPSHLLKSSALIKKVHSLLRSGTHRSLYAIASASTVSRREHPSCGGTCVKGKFLSTSTSVSRRTGEKRSRDGIRSDQHSLSGQKARRKSCLERRLAFHAAYWWRNGDPVFPRRRLACQAEARAFCRLQSRVRIISFFCSTQVELAVSCNVEGRLSGSDLIVLGYATLLAFFFAVTSNGFVRDLRAHRVDVFRLRLGFAAVRLMQYRF